MKKGIFTLILGTLAYGGYAQTENYDVSYVKVNNPNNYYTNSYRNTSQIQKPQDRQNSFFVSVSANNANLWGAILSWAFSSGMDKLLKQSSSENYGTPEVEIVTAELNGEDIVYQSSLWSWSDTKQSCKEFFGFKTMFRNATITSRFGWQNSYSMFVPYVSLKYYFKAFYTVMPGEEDKSDNKMQSIAPGFGIQFMPFKDKASYNEWGWCPFLEMGIEQEIYTKCNSYFGSDKKQLQNGINMRYGAGVNFGGRNVVALVVNIGGHDIFNTDYSPDGISNPYKGIKSRNYSLQVSMYKYF